MTSDFDFGFGALRLGAFRGELCLCDWIGNPVRERDSLRRCRTDSSPESVAVLKRAGVLLDGYLSGQVSSFEIPICFSGSDFEVEVWNELMKIPYGLTATYSDIAARINRPHAVRAVASAIGRNRISVFVPCHRVIGADGSLRGYAGGIDVKRRLLSIESVNRVNQIVDGHLEV